MYGAVSPFPPAPNRQSRIGRFRFRTTEAPKGLFYLTLVNRDLVQHRVRPCEVNVLEEAWAELGAFRQLALEGVHLPLHVHKHAFAGRNVACSFDARVDKKDDSGTRKNATHVCSRHPSDGFASDEARLLQQQLTPTAVGEKIPPSATSVLYCCMHTPAFHRAARSKRQEA